MIMIMINIKSFLERNFLWGFSKTNVFMKKKAVLHTTPLMHCKARQVSRDLFSSSQGNGSDMTFAL